MQTYYTRNLTASLIFSLQNHPVTALLGPRQCGKTTLVRQCLKKRKDTLFLDLELPSDLRRLSEPEFFLGEHADKLVCIDEIQQMPELFPLIRALIDRDRRSGRFLLLGSASQDLIRKGTETLAGRIHYLNLTPFLLDEIHHATPEEGVLKTCWWRGGFPLSYLAKNDALSREWLDDFIQTFMSRDIPELGFSIPAAKLFRFWRMVSHYHGQLLNASKIAQSLGWSHTTVFKYIDLLEQTFMLRTLPPMAVNFKKRLVKSPKIYICDTGILHALQEIHSFDDLFAHPMFGASWEGYCIEQITQCLPHWRPSFYRTSSGEEIDLILEKGQRRIGFECKASLSPKLSKGFNISRKLLDLEQVWIVCPMKDFGYNIKPQVKVSGLIELLSDLSNIE